MHKIIIRLRSSFEKDSKKYNTMFKAYQKVTKYLGEEFREMEVVLHYKNPETVIDDKLKNMNYWIRDVKNNIAIVEDKTWVATTAGRVYYSEDKGETWEFVNTPIVNKKDTEGIYSVDFYDDLNGFAIGGDYTKPDGNIGNKVKTVDGGKTWQLVADGQTPNYRSCVQYIPNRNGQELVAVGFKGIDYSNDGGDTCSYHR